MGDTGVVPFTWDSFRLFLCSFGALAGVLGLMLVGFGAGLLVTGIPLTWAWAAILAFILLLFLLPVLGGWSPLVVAGLAPSCMVASTSCVVPSDLRFLRFLVSGKNPFFFRFMLTGLCVAVGTSLASFFSDLGRLGGSELSKEVSSEGRSDRHLSGPMGLSRPKLPPRGTRITMCAA